MLGGLRAVGLAVMSIKGWVAMIGIVLTAMAALIAWLDSLSWTQIYLLILLSLCAAVWLALISLRLFEAGRSYLTSKATRDRIIRQIDEYTTAGETMVDTPTAAAIWAGTMEIGDIQRHLYFRMLKLAVDNGTIKNVVLAPGQRRANKDTRIPLSELVSYLKLKGVLG
ncbi:hypothetical protein [Mesorhizobium sp.]|uniref:hypothetical protein n=1 Tax=Mesorhizobium sp. TaxID=1871066 RepID=UPI000FE8795B|nr:hypothetical protein [Mesorhizobium sp.]RWQ58833.1 MAG: hypothetical protein EOS83_12580 [Mesorhizobium sp.]